MSKRRYRNFIFHTGEDDYYESSCWKRVFTSFQRAESAIIYGLPDYDGASYEIVMSK